MTSCRKCCRDVILWHTACILLLCSCPVILLAVGFGVVAPYSHTRQFSGRKSTCIVRVVLHHPSIECHCRNPAVKNPACRSSSPCVEIRVDYVSKEKSDVVRDAMLYDDPYMYGALKNKQCSTLPCDRDVQRNNKTVSEFIRNYGAIGHTLLCYPGIDSDPEALMSLIGVWQVYVGMIIPGVVFLVAAIAEFCYMIVYPRYGKVQRQNNVDKERKTDVTNITGSSNGFGKSYVFNAANKNRDKPTPPNKEKTDKTTTANTLVKDVKRGGENMYCSRGNGEISDGGGKFGAANQTKLPDYSHEKSKYKSPNKTMNEPRGANTGAVENINKLNITCAHMFAKSDMHRASDISSETNYEGEISGNMDKLRNEDITCGTSIW